MKSSEKKSRTERHLKKSQKRIKRGKSTSIINKLRLGENLRKLSEFYGTRNENGGFATHSGIVALSSFGWWIFNNLLGSTTFSTQWQVHPLLCHGPIMSAADTECALFAFTIFTIAKMSRSLLENGDRSRWIFVFLMIFISCTRFFVFRRKKVLSTVFGSQFQINQNVIFIKLICLEVIIFCVIYARLIWFEFTY